MTGVVLPFWPDRPPAEALEVASAADELGFEELWIGEMATFDAFALAGTVAASTKRIPLTVGPLAAGVRDPVSLALGMATVCEVAGGRPVRLALGASTPAVVRQWHGRSWERPVRRLRETVAALRPILAGERSSFEGSEVSTHGFRLRTAPPNSAITVAAFGDASVAVAAELADRMVINLVTPAQAVGLRARLETAARAAGRRAPPLAAWVLGAVDPSDETFAQLRRAVVAYLAAPGYGEMFSDAGFGALVERARGGAHPRELAGSIPEELIEAVGAVGDDAMVRARISEFRDAGVDQLAIVPATAGDPAGRRTLMAVLGA